MNFQNLGKAKIILAVISIVSVIVISVSIAISNLHRDNGQTVDSSDNRTNQTANTTNTTTETTTEYDASELGFFYYLNTFSDTQGKCILLEICGFDKNDRSVWFWGNRDDAWGWTFQNGFIRETEDIELGDTYISKYSYGDEVYEYRTLNENEICTYSGENFIIKSQEKMTSNSVIYSCSYDFYSRTIDVLCVPATMIDWSTKEYIYINGKECIKYSVK